MFPTAAHSKAAALPSSSHAASSQSASQRLVQTTTRGRRPVAGALLPSSTDAAASGSAQQLALAAPPLDSVKIKQEHAGQLDEEAQQSNQVGAFLPKTEIPTDTRLVLPASFTTRLTDSYAIAMASGSRLREEKERYREECENAARNLNLKLEQRKAHAERYAAIDDCKAATAAISKEIQKAVQMHAEIMEQEHQIMEAESELEAELNAVKREKRLTIKHFAGLKRFAREQAEQELALAVLAKNAPQSHARLLSLRPKYVECAIKISETERKVVETQAQLDAAETAKANRRALAKEAEEAQRKAVIQAERICTNTLTKLVPRLRSRVLEAEVPVHCARCDAPLKPQLPAINKRIVDEIMGNLPKELWEPIKEREDEKQRKEQEEKEAAERAIREQQLQAEQQRLQQQQEEAEEKQRLQEQQYEEQQQEQELESVDDGGQMQQQEADQYQQGELQDDQQPQEGEQGYDDAQQQDPYGFDYDPYQRYEQSPSNSSAGQGAYHTSPFDQRPSIYGPRTSPYGLPAAQFRPYVERSATYASQGALRQSPYGFAAPTSQGVYGQRSSGPYTYGRFNK